MEQEFLKDWSGGGQINFRLNFENEIRVAPAQFMMHFACNNMIEVNGSDGGVRNRMNKIDYRSRFVDGDSQVNAAALRYKKDISIKERFSGWAPEFMRMLLQRYKHGYVPPVPVSVESSTTAYLNENDECAKFKELFLAPAEEECNFTAKEAQERWQGYQDRCQLAPLPSKAKLIEGLTVLLGTDLHEEKMVKGKRRRNAWWGWRLLDQPALLDEDGEDI